MFLLFSLLVCVFFFFFGFLSLLWKCLFKPGFSVFFFCFGDFDIKRGVLDVINCYSSATCVSVLSQNINYHQLLSCLSLEVLGWRAESFILCLLLLLFFNSFKYIKKTFRFDDWRNRYISIYKCWYREPFNSP